MNSASTTEAFSLFAANMSAVGGKYPTSAKHASPSSIIVQRRTVKDVIDDLEQQARKKQAKGAAAKVMMDHKQPQQQQQQQQRSDEGNAGDRLKPAKVVSNNKQQQQSVVEDERIEGARNKPAAKVIMNNNNNKKRAVVEDDGKKPVQKKPSATDTTTSAVKVVMSHKKRALDDGKKPARKKQAVKVVGGNKKKRSTLVEDGGKKKQARTTKPKGATKVVGNKSKRPVIEEKKTSKRGKISFRTKPQDVLGYDPDRNNPGNILFRELVASHSLDFNTDHPDLSVQSLITAIEVQGGRFLSANNQMVLSDSEVTAKVWVALNCGEQTATIAASRRDDLIGKSSSSQDNNNDNNGVRTTDVVGGIGWCHVMHPGNLVFRDAVARYAEDYNDPLQVSAVINLVVKAVHRQDPPGRFLSNDNQCVLSKAQARKKVAGALNAKLKSIQRKGREQQQQQGEQSTTGGGDLDRLSNLLQASAKRTARKMDTRGFVSTQDLFESGKASTNEGGCKIILQGESQQQHGASSLTSSLTEGGNVASSCGGDADDADAEEEELCALQNILKEAVQVDVFAHDSLRRGAMRRVFNPKIAR